MKHVGLLENVIQDYAWGSLTAIPELVGGKTPSEKPQAELWMGAHPKAPSQVKTDGGFVPLDLLIENNPDAILGSFTAEKFSNKLPYLFKVLAAAKPLSIQAHPTRTQAEEGFERENKLGIALDAAHRNYKDDNHKPECLCALTEFWGVCGFRKIPDILSLFEKILPQGLSGYINDLRQQPNVEGLKTFFTRLMALSDTQRSSVIKDAVSQAGPLAKTSPEYKWIIRLFDEYTYDIGVLSPIFLNLICLQPGQAIFLNAGELHAYLEGMGIELMANSDNVLRGGLTPKHIDQKELLRVLNFQPRTPEILLPVDVRAFEQEYPGHSDEFVLSVIHVDAGQTYIRTESRGPEILLCTRGNATITEKKGRKETSLLKGESVIIPASVPAYSIEGCCTLYKASVPV